MASAIRPISQSHAFSADSYPKASPRTSLRAPFVSFSLRTHSRSCSALAGVGRKMMSAKFFPRTSPAVVSATMTEVPKKKRAGESKGFVDEMRAVAMKLHTRDQAKEGEKESDAKPLSKWEPSIQGYLKFLVDSKLVYDTLDTILEKAAYPWYAEFKNTGLERSESLAKDLDWFKAQGHTIPEPSSPGLSYSCYLEELSEKDPQAFICHFYNFYFAHTAGGRMIGKKVAAQILDNKELEFYKWDGDLSQLLQNVREKLNRVATSWSREEKDHCLEETEKSFKYSGEILRLILS